LAGIQSTPTVVVWGWDRLAALLEQHPAVADEILQDDSIAGVKRALAVGPEDAEKQLYAEQRARLEELRKTYAAGNLTLFLGAGVSQSKGLPNWNSLIDGLAVGLVMKELGDVDVSDDEILTLAKRVHELSGGSPLIAVRYLRRGLASSFEDLESVLYRRSEQRDGGQPNLLEEIASACQPRRSKAGIRAVITFNFDDLLEEELEARRIAHRPVFREGQSADPDELPIYHVHGFLPRDPISYQGIDPKQLAFSEEGYHRMFADPFHWSNLVQLNHLREGPCLMLGLSMSDPNLRRLLEVAARGLDDPRHYAFMQRLTLDKFLERKQADRRADKDNAVTVRRGPAEAFLRSHHSLQEDLFRELQIQVVWFEDFKELPGYVKAICNRSG
jgi:hypothetical protein